MNYKHKQFWKFFVIILSIGFFVVCWKEILIFTNYKVVWHKTSDFFDQLKQKITLNFKPKTELISINFLNSQEDSFANSILEISKIKISVPIVFNHKTVNAKALQWRLRKQGVLLNSKTMPGEKGAVVVLGHSTYAGWPDIDYSNIFNKLNQLKKEDEIAIYYNQKKYIYKVFDKKIFLSKNKKQILSSLDKNRPILVLLTCWPLGSNNKRLAILAQLNNL